MKLSPALTVCVSPPSSAMTDTPARMRQYSQWSFSKRHLPGVASHIPDETPSAASSKFQLLNRELPEITLLSLGVSSLGSMPLVFIATNFTGVVLFPFQAGKLGSRL